MSIQLNQLVKFKNVNDIFKVVEIDEQGSVQLSSTTKVFTFWANPKHLTPA